MNYVVAGSLSEKQIEDSVNAIIQPFKDNSLPQLRLQNRGEYKQLTQEEIAKSCSSVYEDLWQSESK